MTEDRAELEELPAGGRAPAMPHGVPPAPIQGPGSLPARRPLGDRGLIVCDNLVKIYKVADLEVVALQGLDMLVEHGEFIARVCLDPLE